MSCSTRGPASSSTSMKSRPTRSHKLDASTPWLIGWSSMAAMLNFYARTSARKWDSFKKANTVSKTRWAGALRNWKPCSKRKADTPDSWRGTPSTPRGGAPDFSTMLGFGSSLSWCCLRPPTHPLRTGRYAPWCWVLPSSTMSAQHLVPVTWGRVLTRNATPFSLAHRGYLFLAIMILCFHAQVVL